MEGRRLAEHGRPTVEGTRRLARRPREAGELRGCSMSDNMSRRRYLIVPGASRVSAVRLPRPVAAVFPDRCVVCRGTSPGSTTRIVARDSFSEGVGPFVVRVPCCRACAARLHAGLLWSLFRGVLVVAGAIAIGGWFLLSRLGWWLTALAVLGLCCIGFFLVAVWNRLRPAAFSVDPHLTVIDYEFRDSELAREFALLNEVPP
jgi:hypothetical protein